MQHEPLFRSLQGSMLELALRVGRIERHLRLDSSPAALGTFGRGEQQGTSPDYTIERCSCEESVMLRARVRELEAAVAQLGATG